MKKRKNFSTKIKRWWHRTGSKWLTFEIVMIAIFLLAVFILFLKFRSKKPIAFQGLSDTDIGAVNNIPVKNVKVYSSNSKVGKKNKVYKREEMCRSILQKIYGKPFPSVRPDFLKSPATGRNLELDCYNKELGIALEHDGSQHSSYTPYFHRNGPSEFTYQVARDDWKNMRCKQENITLIRVPQWVPELDLEKYIRNKLREANKL